MKYDLGWTASKRRIMGKRCIRRVEPLDDKFPNVFEHTLVGEYGEIWENGDDFKAVITSAEVAKKHLPKELHPIQKGDEVVVRFTKAEFEHYYKILKIRSKPETQIRLALNFSA